MRSKATWMAAIALVAAWPAAAAAQTFPADDAYSPFRCGAAPMTDGFQDEAGAVDERDLVGDVDHPAGYRVADDEFLYLRLRLENDAIPSSVQPYAWGFEFDTDGDGTDYELLAIVDGVGQTVELHLNTSTAAANDPTDPAEQQVASYQASTHARSTVAAGTTNGGDADYFLSFAVAWTDLVANGLDRDTAVVVWAASSSAANLLNGDFACHDGTTGDPALSDIDGDRTDVDPNGGGGGGGDLAFAGGGGCTVGGPAAGPCHAGLLALALAMAMTKRNGRARRGRRS